MLKSTCVTIIALMILTAATAASQPFRYECTANDKKVIAQYSRQAHNRYELDVLTIDGQDYKASTRLSVSRGSAAFVVDNYRDGKPLIMKIGVENFYRLGENGTVYQMLCYPARSSPNTRSNDQL